MEILVIKIYRQDIWLNKKRKVLLSQHLFVIHTIYTFVHTMQVQQGTFMKVSLMNYKPKSWNLNNNNNNQSITLGEID